MDSYFWLTYEQYMERVIDKARNNPLLLDREHFFSLNPYSSFR